MNIPKNITCVAVWLWLLVLSPGAEAFQVPEMALPKFYRLNLKTNRLNAADNFGNRQSSGSIAREGVVTREGLLVALVTEMRVAENFPFNFGWSGKSFLRAIDANGNEAWRIPELDFRFGDRLLFANHQGLDVVLLTCSSEKGGGLYVLNAKTGEALSEGCTNPGHTLGSPPLALLQGGPEKELVVVRKMAQEEPPMHPVLEACRMRRSPNATSDVWDFDCHPSTALSERGSGAILVQQTSKGVFKVFVNSITHHWCALEWKDEGGWSPGNKGSSVCVQRGPDVADMKYGLKWAEVQLLGSKRLWGSYEEPTDSKSSAWSQPVNQNAAFVSLPHKLYPLLVDSNDVLIAVLANSEPPWRGQPKDSPPQQLQRLSASGKLLFKWEGWPQGLALMEGGMVIFLGVEPSSKNLQVEDIRLLGILPVSSTRSLAIFSFSNKYFPPASYFSGIFIDSPGLKKDAPWPIGGHDLCRTYNTSVPVDNCWDGPSTGKESKNTRPSSVGPKEKSNPECSIESHGPSGCFRRALNVAAGRRFVASG
ncbi:MAG: hypothetical protein FWC28_01820 [Proteobacteria bacterium]|nr:hypothetical protein [Cystobacterineae bacterium]MCL2259545.1 hypothetical protein [Cystobacterineae bacterium]MCL2313977.1 hypothetical protein [Pseudomonadota bacterium]